MNPSPPRYPRPSAVKSGFSAFNPSLHSPVDVLKTFMLLLRFAVIILSILVLAPSAHSASPAFSGLTITRIDLKDDFGNPWQRPDQIEELIGLKPGDVLTGAAVREGISLLYLKGIFRDIIVEE